MRLWIALQIAELAILGANDTNTAADARAIDAEAEAIADEFNRLLVNAKYKGKSLFVSAAGSELIAIGGRGAEMTFGIQEIDYSALYSKTALTATATMVEGRRYIVTTAETTDTTLLTGNGAPAATASATEFIATGGASLNQGRVQQVANQLTVAASEGRTDSDVDCKD